MQDEALSIFKKENLSLSIFQSEFLKINRKIENCKISDGRLETTALLYYSLYSQSSSIFEDQQKTLLRRQAWKTLEARSHSYFISRIRLVNSFWLVSTLVKL